MMPVAMGIVSYDQKSHGDLQFVCLDLRKVVFSLTVLMPSCDESFSHKEWNGVIDDAIIIM